MINTTSTPPRWGHVHKNKPLKNMVQIKHCFLSLWLIIFLGFPSNSWASESGALYGRPVDPKSTIFQPGRGWGINSADGDFKWSARLRAQLRYTMQQNNDALTQGLQLRRARLAFTGHVFGKENAYKFELAVSPRDIGLTGVTPQAKSPLLDWYFEFRHLRDARVRMGQYKVPFSRQRVVSSGNLQMVDRSLANGEFNLDRDVGLDIRSKDVAGLGLFRYYAGVYMGEGHSSYANGDFGLMYLGRVECLPLGMFKDYSEGDFARSPTPKLSVGAAFGYIDRAKKNRGILGRVPADGGTTDTTNLTADLSFRWLGWSAESAVFWRKGRRNPGQAVDDMGAAIATEAPRDGLGYYAQLGYLMPEHWLEFSARFGQVLPSTDMSSLSNESEAGVGLSYYFGGHSFKLQADYFRFWTAGAFGSGEDQFRVQIQMAQ